MNVLGAILLSILLIGGCHKNKNAMVISHGESDTIAIDNASANGNLKSGLIKVDVTKKYPLKEIRLQDIADVEYVPLETNEEFLCDGKIRYVGDSLIFFQNKKDGNIFLFNRDGRTLKKINHKGSGPEEYSGISYMMYDPDMEEVYVNNMWTLRVYVYNKDGVFQRSFPHQKGKHYFEMGSFNKKELLCEAAEDSFLLISKKDGHKIKNLSIPYHKKIVLGYAERQSENYTSFLRTYVPSMIPSGNDYILS